MALPTVRVLQTVEHRCGYYPERLARNLVIDPTADHLEVIYDAVTNSGFRRAGDLIFRPHCRGCTACRATRIPVQAFRADRSQRRCWKLNGDLTVHRRPARYNPIYFDLYDRYLSARHPNGGMDNPEPADFKGFLLSSWANSFLLEFRLGNRLLAVSVCDRLASGISAVYTFFDPDESRRSLGTFSILAQIAYVRRHHLPYLYLGYWLPGHPKMAYKTRFRPIEVFEEGGWRAPPAGEMA